MDVSSGCCPRDQSIQDSRFRSQQMDQLRTTSPAGGAHTHKKYHLVHQRLFKAAPRIPSLEEGITLWHFLMSLKHPYAQIRLPCSCLEMGPIDRFFNPPCTLPSSRGGIMSMQNQLNMQARAVCHVCHSAVNFNYMLLHVTHFQHHTRVQAQGACHHDVQLPVSSTKFYECLLASRRAHEHVCNHLYPR
jgi:hypothetical protein